MSFVKSTASSNNENLFYVQGKDAAGRDAFYYVLVDKLKKRLFLKDVESKQVDLREYGEILTSDFGVKPTKDAMLFLKNEYDLDGTLQEVSD